MIGRAGNLDLATQFGVAAISIFLLRRLRNKDSVNPFFGYFRRAWA